MPSLINNNKEIDQEIVQAPNKEIAKESNQVVLAQSQLESKTDNEYETVQLYTISNHAKTKNSPLKKPLSSTGMTRSHDKKTFVIAKKLEGENTQIYNAKNFLKNNIFTTGNSKPTVNEEGYLMKRSIIGSVE